MAASISVGPFRMIVPDMEGFPSSKSQPYRNAMTAASFVLALGRIEDVDSG